MPSLPRKPLVLETRSAEETRRLGVTLTPALLPGDVLSLSGELGAGKTTFAQGVGVGLGISEWVTSPTFIIVKEYLGGKFPLFHVDLYRLDRVQEVIDLGLDELFEPIGIVVVEWGDVVEPLLPPDHLVVDLRHSSDESVRKVMLSPRGSEWIDRFDTISILTEELFSPTRDHDVDKGGES